MTSPKQIQPFTFPTLPTVGQQPAWVNWIITLTFSCQSLMDALLGFSAFHLRSLNPSDQKLQQISHKYMLRALKGHAIELRKGVDAKNVEALFATSTFVACHSCLGQKYLLEKQGPPLHWFQAYQGVRAVAEAGWQWIKDNEIRALIVNERHFMESVIRPGGEVIESHYAFLLKDLDLGTHDSETIDCYRSSIALLDWVHNTGITRHIIRFLSMVSRRFIELLAVEDPRVLTIVGYFFVLLKRVDDVWWLGDTVESEF